MAAIASLESRAYRVPLPVALSDSTHGTITHFELMTAELRDADGAEGLGYTYTVDSNGLAVHAFLEMRFRTDSPPGFALGSFKAGERVRKRFCGFYKLRDGKICEFRVFPFLGE